MYLWVVLATFLAALAAYILPLRGDMASVVDAPIAQAMMMKMVVKHKAGLEYMKRNAWPYSCASGNNTFCQSHNTVDYVPGILTDNDVADYMPFGFVNDANYTNEIRCLYLRITNGVPIYSQAIDCNTSSNESEVLRALLTYGPIPEHWLVVNGDIVKPSGDLTTAMRKHFGFNQMAGYVVHINGSKYIRNFEGTDFLIPPQFTSMGSNCDNQACFAYVTWR